MYKAFLAVSFALLMLSLGCVSQDGSSPVEEGAVKVTMFKSPYCGCCSSYADYLRSKGYEVDVVKVDDMASVKEKFGIPADMESCHTMKIGEYFVEGHVPVGAIEKLLSGKPDVLGIALTGMPSGSPGMGGTKTEPFEVYSISKGGEKNVFYKE